MSTGHRSCPFLRIGIPLMLGPMLGLIVGPVNPSIAAVVQSPTTTEESAQSLEQRIRAEAATQWEWNGSIPRPSQLADWAPPPADLQSAMLTPEQLRALYAEHVPAPVDPVAVSAQDRQRAESAFRVGLEHRDAGRTDQAISSFRSAARSDPNDPVAWAELGHALLEANNAIAAKSSFREAIARGESGFRTMFAYGALASRFREDQAAAASLLMAANHPDRFDDPATEALLASELGACLLRLGHLDAGSEFLSTITDLPDRLEAESEYRREWDNLFRTRRSLLNDAAQASFAIGKPQRSLTLLRAIEALPESLDARETAALCYVMLSSGRPASAAGVVLNRFTRETPDAESIDILAMIARHSDIGPLIASRLDRIAAQLPEKEQEQARQGFTVARSILHPTSQQRLETLRAHLELHPTDITVLREFIGSAPPEATLDLIEAIPSLEPEISELYLFSHPADAVDDGPIRIRRLIRAGSFENALEPAIQAAADDEIDFSALLLNAGLLAEAARGEDADRLLDTAQRQAVTPQDRLVLSRSLLQRGRYRDTLRMLEPIASDEQAASSDRVLAMHFMSLVHDRLGDTDEALRVSLEALDIDAQEFLSARQIARLTDSPASIARLRVVPGAEPELLVSQAKAAMAKEQFDLAERLLLRAWDLPLASDETAEMLASLWLRSDSLPRAEQWLKDQSERFPDRERLLVLLSRVRAEDRRPDESLSGIASAMTLRPGSEVLSREFERILREDFASEDRWLSQARARLANAPRTFATLAEQAEIELLSGDILQAVTLAELAADLAPDMRPVESRMVSSILEEAAREIVNRPRVEADTIEIYKRVFDRLDRPSRGACLGRISIGSIREFPSAEELTELATQTGKLYPDIREEAFIYAAHSVMIADRTGQTSLNYDESRELASEMYAEATRVLTPYPSRVLGEWIDFSQQDLDALTLGNAIRSLGEHLGPRDQRLRDALTHMLTAGSARQQNTLSASMLADAAHHLASQLSLSDDFATAQVLYEEALRIQPDHIETNNSYGYRLLSRGEQFGRAIRMIERAYTLSPNSAHITDSMGWSRYKQGRFADEIDPVTRGVTHGALSLLRRAKSLAEHQDNSGGMTLAFTIDHLGDALWASGDRDQAIEAWNEAATKAEAAMRSFGNVPMPISLEVEIQDLIENAKEKSRAATEDRTPAIEPYRGMP